MWRLVPSSENKEKFKALKVFVKALKAQYIETSSYDAQFIEKINRSHEDFESGRYKEIKTENIWKKSF